MSLNFIDVATFVCFYAVVLGVSLWKSRREAGSEDFFLAGRGLTWPLIGLSIVAANISTEQMVGMAGSGAGAQGLAVSNWQLIGSIGIVLISFTLLPKFLRAGIYTMPEFLEYRYNPLARSLMALITVVIYVLVNLTAVFYSGGLALETIFGMTMTNAVLLLAVIAVIYTGIGGLKAIAWADLFQGFALLAGGVATFLIGLHACGGWSAFATANAAKLHMIRPIGDPDLPWTGVATGIPIAILYYCGLNQFIVQRNLAAKTLKHGQLGMIFAGALWLLVPFAIVMPGIMATQLYGHSLAKPDAAYPTLIRNLIPIGVRGFILAAIAGAVISTLASLLNSASTILTMDVYKQMIHRDAKQERLVWMGRVLTVVFVVIAGPVAVAMRKNPNFNSVFTFIQQFQGYIWPGVCAAFVGAFLFKRVPKAAGATALLAGPILYGIFQYEGALKAILIGQIHSMAALKALIQSGGGDCVFFGHKVHYLYQVVLDFVILMIALAVMTLVAPLKEPQALPVREEMNVKTEPVVYVVGGLVIAGVVAFVAYFR
jgi:SSS family solute:Na+ symporter